MAHPLQHASVRRKVWYFAAILALFTLSLFWRGKLGIPLGDPDRKQAPSAVAGLADRVARLSIADQARPERLDLREIDQGDAEIAASAVRLMLTGSRGLAVTVTWKAAIEKQKRGEFHEFEMLARTVTRLQPNFIDPWIFQGWNIAYNVSVETDKLGDMYFYIARGIELLTQGDRLNTKKVMTPDGDRMVGSPDLRYQTGFYYQNKFGVSDKVNTLRCLMQLSSIPPAARHPTALRAAPGLPGVDPAAFRKFCETNPQLVRRLRTSLRCERPEEVVGFLEDNLKLPTRYKSTGELAEFQDQFPRLPPHFPESPDEFAPDSPTDDTFDAFLAARGWFQYAIATIPPTKKDAGGRAVPWASPRPGEYDPFKYRMPRAPAYIIFRQMAPRAQTYLAERLAKEGWFDADSRWDPNERAGPNNLWFKRSEGDPDVVFGTPDSARVEWGRAYALWLRHGAENALTLDPAAVQTYRDLGDRVPGGLPRPEDFPPERLKALGLTQEMVDAKKAAIYYDQNRSMTNFPYFLATTEAEQDRRTVEARKLLWGAEQARLNAENAAAVRGYAAGLAAWREVLTKYPQFHRPDRTSDRTEEDTYEYELALTGLLKEDGGVRRRAAAAAAAAGAPFPALVEQAGPDFLQAVAENETGVRVALHDPRLQERVRERAAEARARAAGAVGPEAERLAPAAHHLAGAVAGFGALIPGKGDALKAAIRDALARAADRPDEEIARDLLAGELGWLKEYKTDARDDPWIRPYVKDAVRGRLGLSRLQTPAPEKDGGG